MKYLFDSSAIIRAIKENKIDLLTGNDTLEIARYELGNIVWKDYLLQSKISKEEARALMNAIKHALNAMEVHQIAPKEEEILETSGRTGLGIGRYLRETAAANRLMEIHKNHG